MNKGRDAATPATMPDSTARRLAEEANALPYDPDRATRLAWRPAWSIRSRRGAWAAFMELLRARRRG